MRRIDYLTLIEKNVILNWLHSSPDAEWDELALCFWIKEGSKTDTMLRLQNI